MNEKELRQALVHLPLQEVRFLPRVGSTNDIARELINQGGQGISLVYAEEQTAGRGRAGRQWLSQKGASLVFSLAIHSELVVPKPVSLISGLGAISVCFALEGLGMTPRVKWPNDILLAGRKVCGILQENLWQGDDLVGVALGFGLNLSSGSVPPAEQLDFPATSLEQASGSRVGEMELLKSILGAFLAPACGGSTIGILQAMEARLAYMGEWVEVWVAGETRILGQVRGLSEDGSLMLHSAEGAKIAVPFGEIHLRPVV
jgi:BirA family biotin operon repressor/biotin-[acetyl-CoA-carboxylase] ligase